MAKASKRVQKAVSDLSEAREALSRARRALAQLTGLDGPAHLVEKEWEQAHELLEARREKLLAIPGVIGCGLGGRHRGGVHTGEPCITVYVRKKLSPEEMKAQGIPSIPKTVRIGNYRMPVDVLELGDLKRQIDAGASLSPLPPVQPFQGTLGVFARDLDHDDETVALTAMHVTGLRQFPDPISSAPSFCSPSLPTGGATFGKLRQGTMTGIDAAKLELAAPRNAVSILPTIGQVRGWRPTTFPGDQGVEVRLFGAVSRFQSGFIVSPAVSLPSESLDSAILANINTAAGDSGCALVDADNLLLGFLVGQGTSELSNLRVFTPASLVLSRLRCDIPTS
jgi:hypothetical protein